MVMLIKNEPYVKPKASTTTVPNVFEFQPDKLTMVEQLSLCIVLYFTCYINYTYTQ